MPSLTEKHNSAPAAVLSLREVAALLIKHKGLHDGLYNLIFQFQIAIGAVGPSPEAVVPGAMLGVAAVGLEKVDQAGPHTVDAAVVNPAPSPAAAKPAVAKTMATVAPKKPGTAPKKVSKVKAT